MSDRLERLRQFNQRVRERDPDLAEEAMAEVKAKATSKEILEAVAPGAAPTDDLALESIIMRTQRPVLAIRNNDAILEFEDVEDSKTWKNRLMAAGLVRNSVCGARISQLSNRVREAFAEHFVLRYEHYSVVVSKKRRMCFFSAVNIDGQLLKKSSRVAWKWDPRIPKEQQIMNECYGSPPKFSRGHMTRREDPGWGDAATAKRGNEDSMHVANTTPQMQAFNAPIWLALEDYALQHAREEDMKISVFTGPFFKQNDPVMYGIRIPQSFWKVIAFIHDETGALCATGYEMSQVNQLLPGEEFVFGSFQSPQLGTAMQVSIASIEQKAGLSFGGLIDVDPLTADFEAVGGSRASPLLTLDQIRFV